MAASGSKKGKKQKGKTVNLNDFLGGGNTSTVDGKAVVTLKTHSWADEVEDNEDSPYSMAPEQVALPTAPRAARQEIDLSKVPDKPPYKIYVGNLSYDVDEEGLTDFFLRLNLKVQSARLVHENGRMKGYGYVEFEDRQSLVEAFKSDGETFLARKIKIDLATSSGREREGGFGEREGRSGASQITGEGDADDDWRMSKVPQEPSSAYGRGRDSGYGHGHGRDQPYSEADSAATWQRGPPRPVGHDSRSGGHQDRRYNDDRPGYSDWRSSNNDRRDYDDDRRGYHDDRRGYHDDRRGYHDDRRGYNDGGYEPPRRGYDERDSGYGRRDGRYNGYGATHRGRDYNPPRGGHDDYSSSRSTHRYDGYHASGRHDDRGYDRRPSSDAPKERPVLKLAPRTKPVETGSPTGSTSKSVFGAAKPVDTAAREREIEEKYRRKQEAPRESRDYGSSFGSRDIRLNVERRVFNAANGSEHSNGGTENRENERPVESKEASKPAVAPQVKKPSSASIFGAAKPVDTAAREREIDEKLRKERPSASSHSEEPAGERRSEREYSRHSSRETAHHAPKANAWSRGPPGQKPGPRKERRERQLPQSVAEMPQYKEEAGRDFSDQNKYAGLLGSDGDDDRDD